MPKRVLIADDDPPFLETYKDAINKYDPGIAIDMASDGMMLYRKARAMKDSGGEYDLMLSDNGMPAMNGIIAMKGIRKNFFPDTPFYLISSDDIEEAALRDGATGFIDKDDKEFDEKLNAVLARHL